MKSITFALIAVLATFCASLATAQELVGSYVAQIGREDLFNSSGQRLTQPWQILRQDRANFHRFGIRHKGDTSDSFFSSKSNRAKMERMPMDGRIDRRATNAIVNGYSEAVLVRIYGRGTTGTSVVVTVVD